MLLNIYDLGLIDADEFWEVKGVWDWLPALLSKINLQGNNVDAALKAVLDQAEDKAGVPGSTDMIQALGGLYQVVAAMKDPCLGLGKSTTVGRLMKRVNKKTGTFYTEEQALEKTERMCEIFQTIKKLCAEAASRK